jgi:Alpha-kinase family
MAADFIQVTTSEMVKLYQIKEQRFNDLISSQKPSFVLESDAVLHGILSFNPKAPPLGIGMFKTAHFGQLSLTPLATDGLGISANQHVAIKRPYRRNIGRGKEVDIDMLPPRDLGRFAFDTELKKVLSEANLLYWASSLMAFTYDFIARDIAASPYPPPFDIPALRYVNGAVAIAQIPSNSKGPTFHVYLVEEFIDEDLEGLFTKYIQNATARSLLKPDQEGYDIAEFLCFCQHVQYEKTGGSTYISDFQGACTISHIFLINIFIEVTGGKTLLCDPQIMTDQYVFYFIVLTNTA